VCTGHVERESDIRLESFIHMTPPVTLPARFSLSGRTLVGLEAQQDVALRDYLVSRFPLEEQVAGLGKGQGRD